MFIRFKKIKDYCGRIETIEFCPAGARSKKKCVESKNSFEVKGKKRKEEARETE